MGVFVQNSSKVAKDATMSAKDATPLAHMVDFCPRPCGKDATMTEKYATKSAKDASMTRAWPLRARP